MPYEKPEIEYESPTVALTTMWDKEKLTPD
jgi:hypothetical protein